MNEASGETFGLAEINGFDGLPKTMGIEIVEATAQRVVARMPVEGNTQPYGVLHGGASCVLAETAGSIGSALHAGPDGIAAGKIKTLIVFGENIVKGAVSNEKLRERETISEVVDEHGLTAELLAKLDTLIVSDILPSETTKLAHYVLPGAAHAEKRGTFTNGKGRVQKFMKAVEAPGDARAEWEFLHDLVHNVTGQDGFVTIEGLFNQMAKDVSAFNNLTWASLGDTGATVQI